MNQILHTHDLLLKPADIRFAGTLHDYYKRNRVFLKPLEPKRDEAFYTLERQEALLRQNMADIVHRTGFQFYIFEKTAPEIIIGSIGLSHIIGDSFLSCFFGYKLDEQRQGKGYMTQAVRAVTEFAFRALSLHRIEANVMPRNTASRRVLEKCGFQQEGLAIKYLQIDGVWEDHIHMVLRNEALETV